METKHEIIIYSLKVLIAYDIEGVLESIRKSLKPESEILNTFVINLSSYNYLKNEINQNTIDRTSRNIEFNKIRVSILSLIDNISESDLQNYQTILEFLRQGRFRGIIDITPGEFERKVSSEGNSWNNDTNYTYDFDIKINILPLFYHGQMANEENLNKIIYGIYLLQEILDLEKSNLELFKNGRLIEDFHLNGLCSPINSIRYEMGLKVFWKFFPVKNGQKINFEIMNELVTKLNEPIKILMERKITAH